MFCDIHLSEEDFRFCEQNQEAYEFTCHFLTNMAAEIISFHAAQKKILGANFYARGLSQREALEQLENAHFAFVYQIVNYFERKYGVSFNSDSVLKQLAPSAPVRPCWLNSLTREENEKIFAAYQTDRETYVKNMQSLRLSYAAILNCLLAQTDGRI